MHLCNALPEDEPQMAKTCAQAFFDDDFFGRVIHPLRYTYPSDVRIYWHQFLRREWASSRCELLVAVELPSNEQAHETVVGLAIWERQGDANMHTSPGDFSHPGPLPALETTRNRALDSPTETILQDTARFSKPYWAGLRANDCYLTLCYVDPNFQQRGCGRRLTSWDLDCAGQDVIYASATASDGSTDFYLKCGFQEVVGDSSRAGRESNTMMRANVKGGNILFTRSDIDVKPVRVFVKRVLTPLGPEGARTSCSSIVGLSCGGIRTE